MKKDNDITQALYDRPKKKRIRKVEKATSSKKWKKSNAEYERKRKTDNN